jgi:phage I-like protein
VDPFVAPAWPLDPYFGMDGEIRVPPTEFRLFAAGETETEKGKYLFDDVAAASVMEAYGRRKVDLTMDYEHQAMADPPIEAPASCSRWVPQIRNGELWATEVKWTPRAYGYLANGEYRYFSPAFAYEKDSGRVTEVLNVALTNIPAMRGIAPLVAASRLETGKEKPAMDWEQKCKELMTQLETLTGKLSALEAANSDLTQKLSAATAGPAAEAAKEVGELTATLSLPATARSGERISAVAQLTGFRAAVRGLAGVDSDAAALGKLAAWKGDHDEVVKLSTRIVELENEATTTEFKGVLDAAGLTPARRAEIEASAKKFNGGRITKDAVEFARTMLSASARIPAGTVGQPDKSTTEGDLDPVQIQIAKTCGRDPAAQRAELAKLSAVGK